MRRSTDRILVTHQGTLPQPDHICAMLGARRTGGDYRTAAFEAAVREEVAAGVRRQAGIGIDIVNDGEYSKTSFSDYVSDRLGGLQPTPTPYVSPISGRDIREFPEYFGESSIPGLPRAAGIRRVIHQCVEPLRYTGRDALAADIANLKAAVAAAGVEEAYLPAVAPGSIEHWLKNA